MEQVSVALDFGSEGLEAGDGGLDVFRGRGAAYRRRARAERRADEQPVGHRLAGDGLDASLDGVRCDCDVHADELLVTCFLITGV